MVTNDKNHPTAPTEKVRATVDAAAPADQGIIVTDDLTGLTTVEDFGTASSDLALASCTEDQDSHCSTSCSTPVTRNNNDDMAKSKKKQGVYNDNCDECTDTETASIGSDDEDVGVEFLNEATRLPSGFSFILGVSIALFTFAVVLGVVAVALNRNLNAESNNDAVARGVQGWTNHDQDSPYDDSTPPSPWTTKQVDSSPSQETPSSEENVFVSSDGERRRSLRTAMQMVADTISKQPTQAWTFEESDLEGKTEYQPILQISRNLAVDRASRSSKDDQRSLFLHRSQLRRRRLEGKQQKQQQPLQPTKAWNFGTS